MPKGSQKWKIPDYIVSQGRGPKERHKECSVSFGSDERLFMLLRQQLNCLWSLYTGQSDVRDQWKEITRE